MRGFKNMTDTLANVSFRHAFDALRFDAVLELVASGCVNETARAKVRALFPTASLEDITRSLALVEEFRALREGHGDVSIGDTSPREAVARLIQRGEPLEPLDLLRVAATERASAELGRQLAIAPETYGRLSALAAGIVPHPGIVSAIGRALDPDGRVKDSASPALSTIRREINRVRTAIRGRSEKLAAGFGEGAYATILGSRYVLLVPRTRFHRGEGMVHATSHTGGSLYFEPFDLVERNNELETLSSDERAEESRILSELCKQVSAVGPEIEGNMDVIDAVDCVRAQAAFSRTFDCRSPIVSRDGVVRLVAARHPVLVRSLSGESRSVVPLDLELRPGRRVMVVTGPNAGGKTVTLKTLGVAVLLFQCGLPVPCGPGTELPVFRGLLVDIGDEQSMEASLSTFTSHLRHLDTMCRVSDRDTLCLIDEIGDGTDPDEGAALAVASLERLLGTEAAVVATTHYGRIKTYALGTAGVTNASMAFEDAEGRPMYRLLQGVAGRSRGIETARRTGFDPQVLERAEGFLGQDAFRLEAVLTDLEASHIAIEKEREALQTRSAELQTLMERYAAKAAEFEISKREADRRAGREAEEFLLQTRREVEGMVREIRENQAKRETLRKSRTRLDEMLRSARARRETPPAAVPVPLSEVSPGDRVSLNPSGEPAGTVVDVENGVATVEINDKRIKLSVKGLYPAAPGETKARSGVGYEVQAEPLSSTTLDVRGNDREEALEAVNRFIDRAVLSGVQEIRIIHGIGEGVLIKAVRELLQTDRRVSAFRPGGQGEGGPGVTVVTLR